MLQDLRFALRKLAQTPAFSVVAVLVLALGIGGNTAIFSLIDAVLLRPLRYAQPERLVAIYEGIPTSGLPAIPFSAPDYAAFVRDNRSYEAIGGFQNADFELSGLDRPQRVMGARISASLLPALGIQPALGRNFTESEDRESEPVVLISDRLWRSSFATDRGILSRKLLIDRRPYQVIGVMPRSLAFPSRGPEYNNDPADLFVPMSYTPAELGKYGARFATSVIGRLRPGVTIEQARSEGSRMAQRLLEFYPLSLKQAKIALSVSVEPLKDDVIGKSRTLLLVLGSAVLMVLCIACADVACLMLIHAAARQREFAVRTALGAGQWQLVRQVLVESGVLAVSGAVLGVLLAQGAVSMLARASLAAPRLEEVRIDAAALAFTALLVLLTTLLFGLAPAFFSLRIPAAGALHGAGRAGSVTHRQSRLLGIFVSTQFALALVLLVAAGLLIRSFERLLSTDPGFQPAHALAMTVSLPGATYQRASDVRLFYDRLEERAGNLPGVLAAAGSNATPLHMARQVTFVVDDPDSAAGGVSPTASVEYISGSYLPALGVKLESGRAFSAQDGPQTEPVALVNKTLANRFLHHEANSHRIKLGLRASSPWMTIVGVIGDVKQGPLSSDMLPAIYQPLTQVPDSAVADPLSGGVRTRNLLVRSKGDPEAVARSLESLVRELDPALAIDKMQVLTALLSESSAPQRLNAVVLGCFAAAALLLAALGVGGVLSYSTARRTQEIGVRLALGAQRRDVLRLIVMSGMRLAAAGMGIGLLVALAAAKLLSALLYRVDPRDPWIFAAVCGVLLGAAFTATLFPVRRAMRVSPVQALRHD